MLTVVTSNNMKIIVAENLRGFFSKDHPLKVMRSLRFFLKLYRYLYVSIVEIVKTTVLIDG